MHFSADRQPSEFATKEAMALKRLTRLNDTAAPEYIADFRKTHDGVLCGVEHYVLMSKLPGVPLNTVRKKLSQAELCDVRMVFWQAIRYTLIPFERM